MYSRFQVHLPKPRARLGASLGLSFPLTEEGDSLSYLVSMYLGSTHLPSPESAGDFQLTHPCFQDPWAPPSGI